ncbi:MAG: hypothetical protein V7K77_02505 [Nostoc sp.]
MKKQVKACVKRSLWQTFVTLKKNLYRLIQKASGNLEASYD